MDKVVSGTLSDGRPAGLLDFLGAKFGDGRAVVTWRDGRRGQSKE